MRALTLILLIIISGTQVSRGQSPEKKTIYCVITEHTANWNPKVSVAVDTGEPYNSFLNYGKVILEEGTLNPKLFNSMVEALNFMSGFGWKLSQTYVMTRENSSKVFYILSQEVLPGDEWKHFPQLK